MTDPRIQTVTDIADPRVAPFARLSGAQLRSAVDPDQALIIVESPKVIRVALDSGLSPVSLLCERRHICGDAADILQRCPEVPVYVGERDTLASLTGYTLTRGVLCAMRRPAPASLEDVCRGARRIAVIDDVCDTTNIGAIFRSAAALGIDAVLLSPTACDPLNRRSIRVSMGSVFLVPWACVDAGYPETLRRLGFRTVAMALTDRSVSIDDPVLAAEERLAIVLGTEGDGLPQATIDACDFTCRIPMHHGVDSLNVAAASAVAFWQLRAPADREHAIP